MPIQILLAVIGFLWGSVLFSYVLPKVFLKMDVRTLSRDRNPGSANVFAHCGVGWGLSCLFLDFVKGFVPVFLATLFTDCNGFAFALVVVAPVLGHALGVWNGGRGGKCIAVAFGATFGAFRLTACFWLLAGLYLFFSLCVRIYPHRRRSLLTFCLFGALSCAILCVEQKYSLGLGYLGVSAIVAYKHLGRFTEDKNRTSDSRTHTEKSVR